MSPHRWSPIARSRTALAMPQRLPALARRMAPCTASLPLLLVLSGFGCASSPPPAPEPKTAAAPATDDACRDYARQLCGELGERSEGCAAAASTAALMAPSACQAGLGAFEVSRERIAHLREACAAVMERVCADFGEESESCVAVRSDLGDIPPGHCPVLLREYPSLRESLARREAVNRPLEPERWKALAAGTPPSFGPADAAVVVVEFSDFQCPFCARAAETVEKLREKYADRVRFVFRHYPLPFHEHAHLASRAALAAHAQGKFWPYHDLLFANQGALAREDLRAYAKQADLDLAAFDAALDAPATSEGVDADIALGDSVHVRGTPTMIINGRRVENALEFEAVAASVDEALAE